MHCYRNRLTEIDLSTHECMLICFELNHAIQERERERRRNMKEPLIIATILIRRGKNLEPKEPILKQFKAENK